MAQEMSALTRYGHRDAGYLVLRNPHADLATSMLIAQSYLFVGGYLTIARSAFVSYPLHPTM